MSKLVRATDPTTGAEFTTSEAFAKRKELKYTSKDATDRFGRIVRTKRRTDLAGKPTKPTDGKKQEA